MGTKDIFNDCKYEIVEVIQPFPHPPARSASPSTSLKADYLILGEDRKSLIRRTIAFTIIADDNQSFFLPSRQYLIRLSLLYLKLLAITIKLSLSRENGLVESAGQVSYSICCLGFWLSCLQQEFIVLIH